jgi:ABC-type uncharacterized transport system fused permease/ATPase subunit
MVYGLLREELPATSIVSIGHRSTLKALHCCSIDMEQGLAPTRRPADRWQARLPLTPAAPRELAEQPLLAS